METEITTVVDSGRGHTQELSEVMRIFYILITVLVTQMYTFVRLTRLYT
jgi:hypothetical protein